MENLEDCITQSISSFSLEISNMKLSYQNSCFQFEELISNFSKNQVRKRNLINFMIFLLFYIIG